MLRRFSLLRATTWLLTSSALLAVGCGDDTSESTTGQGGQGGGGSGGDTAASTGEGTPSSQVGGPTSVASTSTADATSSTADATSSTADATSSASTGGGAVCGNGDTEEGEECDDGDTDPGDGCSEDCELELVPGCGNGVIERDLDEDCDDGNDEAFDGCENDCTVSPEEVVCEVLDPLPGGGCEVIADGDAKIITGDVLLPYTVLRGGQVAVDEDGNISCVGCDCDAVEPDATIINCPEGVISPGLINTHEHITYAQNDPANDTGERYEHRHDWRLGVGPHDPVPYEGSSSNPDVIRWGELRFLLSGATSLVGSGQASGFLRNLDRDAKEDLDVPSVHFETFPLNDSGGETEVSGCGYPDIDSQQSIEADLAYLPHISEGIDARARNEFICASGSPGEDLLQHQSSFIHAIGLEPGDYQEMAQDGTSLIWSPRSNVALYGDTAVVTVAARVGVNIALGTDWIVSGSHNMFRELACASSLNDERYDGFFTKRDLWRMVTVNAARSLGLEKAIGTLAVGTVADIAIFDGSSLPDYEAIVDGDIDGVHLVIRGGEPIYGDTALLDEIPGAPAGCDPLDQCLSEKSICSLSEVQKSYAALRTSAGNLYGPFFCGALTDEPSCFPTRPLSTNGSTVYSGNITGNDDDGDGIDDGSDNCPNVFNPIRPVDDGAQGDADADAVGDACDPCPLEADVVDCTGINPADEDTDGIPSFYDNCPDDANTTQADSDSDGHGNVCDACPDDPNPGFAPCATTIYDVKTGDVQGAVFLPGVLVTACAPDTGFFVQYHEDDAAYAGPENSGLYVYDPGVVCGSDVAPGDRIDLSGTTSEFFLQIQVGFASYTVTGSGEPAPTPIVLTTAEASSGAPNEYEAVLATVEDVTVTDNAPPPGPGDNAPTGEFEVEGDLRIDNFVFPSMPVPSEGTSYSAITGVLMLKNDNQKMNPRNAGDIDP